MPSAVKAPEPAPDPVENVTAKATFDRESNLWPRKQPFSVQKHLTASRTVATFRQ
jgi:hypothetical protein